MPFQVLANLGKLLRLVDIHACLRKRQYDRPSANARDPIGDVDNVGNRKTAQQKPDHRRQSQLPHQSENILAILDEIPNTLLDMETGCQPPQVQIAAAKRPLPQRQIGASAFGEGGQHHLFSNDAPIDVMLERFACFDKAIDDLSGLERDICCQGYDVAVVRIQIS